MSLRRYCPERSNFGHGIGGFTIGLITKVAEAIGRDDLRVRDWREMNKNLFSALQLERIATFLILSIEVIVASFCIVCTLLLLMAEKAKEIAILKALGASDGAVLRTFITEGVIIGGIGTVIGVSTGASLCAGLAWFGLRLDPDVYYIDRLPINVSAWDYATVTAATLAILCDRHNFPGDAGCRASARRWPAVRMTTGALRSP